MIKMSCKRIVKRARGYNEIERSEELQIRQKLQKFTFQAEFSCAESSSRRFQKIWKPHILSASPFERLDVYIKNRY